MFKRSIASVAAVATLLQVSVVPAQAVSVDVYGQYCTINYTNEEHQIIGERWERLQSASERYNALRGYPAKNIPQWDGDWRKVANGYQVSTTRNTERQRLETYRSQRKAFNKWLETESNKDLTDAENKALLGYQLAAGSLFLAMDRLQKVREACINGQGMSETDLGFAQAPAADNPLSSADGQPNETGIAVIAAGAVVAVLGLIAAVLPMLSSLLPFGL
ncbi:hypothetical protein CPHO_08920 [Corynebacterium phocae]|uniref:Uncharacterized protein n=1 Tax=Corynebacterium phocae TaxID=161895 RepID=A0A1L7D4E7_9CORY|nr:hypothetical protein [Corynebacterium phocae]APT92990.1 hypothetical protein CPHO_08920 [Corynebacterium phocae]KAA8723329.1 hypothetical protein F4V58_08425 [Corynebacterium phocae]